MNNEIGLYSDDGQLIPLSGVNIDISLQNLVSEVTIEQHYSNRESTNIEAIYTFPLSIDAVLLGLTMMSLD